MSNKKIKICFVLQYLSIGGIETRMLNILRKLDRHIFQPTLICERDDGLQSEKFKALNVPILTTKGLLPVNRFIQLKEFVFFLAGRHFKKYDIVMSFLPTSDPFENMLARYGCKKGGFIYALVSNQMMGRKKDWETRAKLAERVVSVSKQTAFHFYANSKTMDKVTVIYNGVDTKIYDPNCYNVLRSEFGIPEDKVIFCSTSRVAPQKGFSVLIDAVKFFSNDHPNIHIVIAGQDKLDGWLQRRIAQEKLGSSMTYLGPVYNVPELLSVCEGIVLTSENEGCPNSLLEGLAMALPAVVTRSGADEFVVNGLSGYTVPVGDSKAIAEKLISLSADKELRKKMGAYGRQWVIEHCTLDVMQNAYENLFIEIGSSSSAL